MAHPFAACERVGEGHVGLDRIVAAAAVSRSRDISRRSELGDDAVCRTLGDSHTRADLAQADARILGDGEKHPGVVRQERPSGCRRAGHISRIAFLDFDFMYREHWERF